MNTWLNYCPIAHSVAQQVLWDWNPNRPTDTDPTDAFWHEEVNWIALKMSDGFVFLLAQAANVHINWTPADI